MDEEPGGAIALLLSIASRFLQLIATALVNFARPIAIICLAVTELAAVKDTNLYHVYHLVSSKKARLNRDGLICHAKTFSLQGHDAWFLLPNNQAVSIRGKNYRD